MKDVAVIFLRFRFDIASLSCVEGNGKRGHPLSLRRNTYISEARMTRSLQQSSRRNRIVQRGKSTLILSSAATLVAASMLPQSAFAASGTWLKAFGGTYDFADPA